MARQTPDSMKLVILSESSPEDLISISNKLQKRTKTFLNINQVIDLCAKLTVGGIAMINRAIISRLKLLL